MFRVKDCGSNSFQRLGVWMVMGLMMTISSVYAQSIWPQKEVPPIRHRSAPVDEETTRLLNALVADPALKKPDQLMKTLSARLKERLTAPVKNAPFPAHDQARETYTTALTLLAQLKNRSGARVEWHDEHPAGSTESQAILKVMRLALAQSYWHIDQGRPQAAAQNLDMLLSLGELLEVSQGDLTQVM